jgi:bifunctional N-acetylglucosamine-1-phosphate-uridyltransferase/glucosamine-1-phosphate-acetyltransferase GlmU-like protein
MLLGALKRLRNDNTQGEYYLTDVPAIMRADGAKVGTYRRNLGDEIIGVNTIEQLAQVEEILSNR